MVQSLLGGAGLGQEGPELGRETHNTDNRFGQVEGGDDFEFGLDLDPEYDIIVDEAEPCKLEFMMLCNAFMFYYHLQADVSKYI